MSDFILNNSATTFYTLIQYILQLISIIGPILFSLAFIVFFWGLSKFILNSGNPAEIKKGKEYMMWGILALFIMISFKAIIALVSGDVFGVSNPTKLGTFLPE